MDGFRLLHPTEDAAFTHPLTVESDKGNRLDYIALSVHGGLLTVRAGIHRINKTKGCKWDNYPVVVDVLLERVDHALGRGTGEQSNKINFARFVRVCGEKGDEKSHKQLQHILKEMTFTPQIAQDWNDSISRSTHPTHSDYADNTPHALGKHHFPLSPSIPLMLPDHTALTALSSSIHYHRAVVCVHELLHKCQTHEHTPQQENSRWMVIGSSKQCDQGAREVSQEKGGNGVFHVHEEVSSA